MNDKKEYEKAFKGVWIPKEIWLNKELGWSEKCLLVEIESLDNENGCYAGNKHFADFFGLSENRISKMISALVKKGYIKTNIKYSNENGLKKIRTIKVVKEKYFNIKQEENMLAKTPSCVGENAIEVVGENDTYNNTSFNNSINNKTYVQQVELLPIEKDLTEENFNKFWDIYGHKLNKGKCFKKFKEVSKKHSIEEILSHTINYKEYLIAKDGNFNFIKNPITFLNNFDLSDDYIGLKNELKNKQKSTNKGYNPYAALESQFNKYKEEATYENDNRNDTKLIQQNVNTFF